MTNDELKTVRDTLHKAYSYLVHLPGIMFSPGHDDDCRNYSCFSCNASSGSNHEPDCEVAELVKDVRAALHIAEKAFDNQRKSD